LLSVFPPDGVAHVVAFVLNSPVLANMSVHLGGCRVLAAGEDKRVFFADSGSVESEDVTTNTRDLLALVLGLRMTKALISSPWTSSGLPVTATSETSRWEISTSSISRG